MRPIIKAEGVGKQYRIGESRAAYGTLRDTVAQLPAALRGRSSRADRNSLWALRDVSFSVEQGEVVGIVGRNGAGKSTLLKLLSRVTDPTQGRIELLGRVGSLLEVGTGFHPELTGRENVYLYGAILGMRRAEIKEKFDAIVDFSGVERFIDTPVKHYSSGMYMRLAFAVPAHLEPEIMLVDEVLAVGDMAFQQKCLEHMKRMKADGMTILLVSHNTTVIQAVCERAIFLEDGKLAGQGQASEVVAQYRDSVRRRQGKKAPSNTPAASDSGITITGFEMFGADGEATRQFHFGEEPRIRISLRAERRIELPVITFGVRRADGVVVCNFTNWYDNFNIDYIEGECTLEGWLPPLRLIPHFYEIHVLVWPTRHRSASEADIGRLRPLAMSSFDDFTIEGLPLTEGDGVFQQPAQRWILTRNGERIVHDDIQPDTIFAAYKGEAPLKKSIETEPIHEH